MITVRRRQFLIYLAGTALLVAHGCAVFSRETELDAALAGLDAVLNAVGGDNDDELVAITARIKEQAQTLLQAHEDFASEFNRKAADREVSAEMLEQLVRDYDLRRLALRNQLLRSQDDLHAAVPADAWPDVLEVLNKKGRAVVPRRARQT